MLVARANGEENEWLELGKTKAGDWGRPGELGLRNPGSCVLDWGNGRPAVDAGRWPIINARKLGAFETSGAMLVRVSGFVEVMNVAEQMQRATLGMAKQAAAGGNSSCERMAWTAMGTSRMVEQSQNALHALELRGSSTIPLRIACMILGSF